MKSNIVADGNRRLVESPDIRLRRQELLESINERHQPELRKAGFFGRMIVRLQIAFEYRKNRRDLFPSAQALYDKINRNSS